MVTKFFPILFLAALPVLAQEEKSIAPIDSFATLKVIVFNENRPTMQIFIDKTDTPPTFWISVRTEIDKNGVNRLTTTRLTSNLSDIDRQEIEKYLIDSNFKELTKTRLRDEEEILENMEENQELFELKDSTKESIMVEVRMDKECYPVLGEDIFVYYTRTTAFNENIKKLFLKLIQIAAKLDQASK